MSTVLNRSTLQMLYSVNTPEYSDADWVINPDLSGVAGIAPHNWKLTGDVVSEMDTDEKLVVAAAELPVVKAQKISAIDHRTDELIDGGFTYSSKQFSLSMSAQAKMMGTHQVKDSVYLTYPINWNSLDDTDMYSIADAADLDAFYLTALGTIRAALDSGTALKDDVRAATTAAEVDAVVDAR